jgi:hypothetical protein
VTRRWAPLLVASILTALVAGGVGLAADQLATPGADPAPRLKTVPASTLTRLGITLSATRQPPYCGLTDTAVRRGWLPPGSAGCAISQASAEAAARQGGRARVVESVLARATSARASRIGRNRPAWLVVLQGSLSTQFRTWPCQLQGSTWTTCPTNWLTSSRLVLVDATSGSILSSLTLSPFVVGWPATTWTRVAPGAPG